MAQKNHFDEFDPVLSEQTESLYKAMPVSLLASMVNAILLALLIKQGSNLQLLSLWLTSMVGVLLFRGVLWNAYRKATRESKQHPHWVTRFNIGTILAALSWTIAIIFLFPEQNIIQQSFLAFIVAGISSGGVTSLSYLRLPIIAFLTLMLLPLSARFFALNTQVSWAMGSLIVLYYIFVMRNAMVFHHNTRQNIQLRLEAVRREKSLRESEEHSRTLINSVPVGVFQYNAGGEIIGCNETLATIVGKPADMLIGTKLITAECKDDPFTQALNDSLSGLKGYFLGTHHLCASGSNGKIRAIMRGISDGDDSITGGVCVIEDLSDETRLDRMKNEFISIVSHELRTPLTAIMGTLKLLDSGAIPWHEERARQMLDMALSNTDRLYKLINELLDINKFEQNKVELAWKPIDLLSLAQQAIDNNKSLEATHNVVFCLDQSSNSVWVNGDRYRLLQVLKNLLSNAAKFSPESGLILLRVNSSHDHAYLSVSDNGPGIDEKDKERIFEKFVQLDSSANRRYEGTGLGLSVVKTIIEQHHGKVSVDCLRNSGTTFTIDLPAAEMQQVSNSGL